MRLVACGLLLASSLFGQSLFRSQNVTTVSFTPIAQIAKASKAGLTGATTDAIDTTGANKLIAVTSSFGDTPCSNSMTDSKSNTWVCDVQETSGNSKIAIWSVANPIVGSGHTATYTGVAVVLSFSAWSNTANANKDVSNSGNNGAGTTTVQPGSITPSADNALVITGVTTNQGSGFDWIIASGYTVIHSVDAVGGTNVSLGSDYQIQTTATATNPTWTGTSAVAAAVIAAYAHQ